MTIRLIVFPDNVVDRYDWALWQTVGLVLPAGMPEAAAAHHVRRVLRVPVTFLGLGAPATLNVTGHRVKRKFRAAVTLVDAASLGAWQQVRLERGLVVGEPIVGWSRYEPGGVWDNRERWDLCEDARKASGILVTESGVPVGVENGAGILLDQSRTD
jgi:hypothetical protein